MERMRFSDLGPSVLYGLVVVGLVLLLAPTQKVEIQGHVMVGATKVVEAVVAGIFFTTFHVIFRFFVEFRNAMHAVVVTDMRLFYIRQKFRLPGSTLLGSDLRVDAFRHDRNLFYGRCTTQQLPYYFRMMGYRYMPGTVYMQSKMGVLKLMRENGNAMDVFHVVSQLARRSGGDAITEERLRKAGCNQALLDECKKSVEKGLFIKKDKDGNDVKGVWDIHLQPTDVVRSLDRAKTSLKAQDFPLLPPDHPMRQLELTRANGAAWLNPFRADACLVVKDRWFFIHKPLVQDSGYLMHLLSEECRCPEDYMLRMEADADCLELVLRWMYTGEASPQVRQIKDLLSLGRFLLMSDAFEDYLWACLVQSCRGQPCLIYALTVCGRAQPLAQLLQILDRCQVPVDVHLKFWVLWAMHVELVDTDVEVSILREHMVELVRSCSESGLRDAQRASPKSFDLLVPASCLVARYQMEQPTHDLPNWLERPLDRPAAATAGFKAPPARRSWPLEVSAFSSLA
ncbi:unnamed protein product [Effrenium voratum]|uniref:BTB domain-containing protein n=1 Tax=Effrenium voratum TaxID=2562239 RepID=A0AA36J9D7_9DINO|nr:unnamed protein product [Effrenium voratum]